MDSLTQINDWKTRTYNSFNTVCIRHTPDLLQNYCGDHCASLYLGFHWQVTFSKFSLIVHISPGVICLFPNHDKFSLVVHISPGVICLFPNHDKFSLVVHLSPAVICRYPRHEWDRTSCLCKSCVEFFFLNAALIQQMNRILTVTQGGSTGTACGLFWQKGTQKALTQFFCDASLKTAQYLNKARTS